MILDHEHQFIFQHVPRTGGSSITHALARKEEVPDAGSIEFQGPKLGWQLRFHRQDRTKKGMVATRVGKNIHARRDALLTAKARYPHHRVAAFVRDPYDRAISLWSSVQYSRTNKGPMPTLIDFLRDPTRFLPGHAPAMTELVARADVDFLGRYESLESDFLRMCEKYSLPHRSLPHVNRATRPDSKLTASLLTDERCIQLINKRYRADFTEFGYEMVTP